MRKKCQWGPGSEWDGASASQVTAASGVLKVICGRRRDHRGKEACQLMFKKSSSVHSQMFFECILMTLGAFICVSGSAGWCQNWTESPRTWVEVWALSLPPMTLSSSVPSLNTSCLVYNNRKVACGCQYPFRVIKLMGDFCSTGQGIMDSGF